MAAAATETIAAPTDEQLAAVKADLFALFKEKPCMPFMVRLAWHDAGTWDASTKTGGANASVRFSELKHAANAGLEKALALIEPIHEKHTWMSYADLFQFASVTGIEFAGGPIIPFRCGRKDVTEAEAVADGRLPDAKQGSSHLRDIFYRMGFNDQEIVALSGAHCLGSAHADRSGFDGAWTATPLKWSNSYFQNILAPKDGLLVLPSDKALIDDEKMRPFVEKYATDLEAFNADYVAAHKKLSEFGMDSA